MVSLRLAEAVGVGTLEVETHDPTRQPLRSDVWLTLQTSYAQLLIRGRDSKGKAPIVGLIGFADRLRLIWHAAQANDPYADWWLIKVHDAISTVDARIKYERESVRKVFDRNSSFIAVPAQNREPFRTKLRFASPYAYRAAQMLAEFDSMTCELLTGRHIGRVARREATSIIHSVASKIRGVFNIPLRYRHLGIDRANPLSWEAEGEIAKRYMGDIPKDILDGKRRAAFAPPILTGDGEWIPPLVEIDEATEKHVF
ncbi:MAG: TIGR03761 family integrating conjugative element protein [Gammaproteobacteria bacterium]|nr:TIGR03761 family integrating conjugative element protein [Gammaproteobacteria bacterium]